MIKKNMENPNLEKQLPLIPIINTIEIHLHTNIIPKKDPVILTKTIFSELNLTDQNEYPFFTENYLLPKSKINILTYEKRVILFFNKTKFKNLIIEHGVSFQTLFDEKIKSTNYEQMETSKIQKIRMDIRNEIIKKNIDLLIETLLPTTFPIVGNYTDSFSEYISLSPKIKITLQNSIPTVFSNFIPTRFLNSVTTGYAYLKINDEIYTVTKSVFLNDFINNPKYMNIINEYTKFKEWKHRSNLNIQQDLQNTKEQFIKKVNEFKLFFKDTKNTCVFLNNISKSIILNTYSSTITKNNKLIYESIISFLNFVNLKYIETKTDKDETKYTKLLTSIYLFCDTNASTLGSVSAAPGDIIFEDKYSTKITEWLNDKKDISKLITQQKSEGVILEDIMKSTTIIKYLESLETIFMHFSNESNNLKDTVKNLSSVDYVNVPRSFTTKFNEIMKLLQQITTFEEIKNTYFNEKNQNINLFENENNTDENETQNIKSYFNEKYEEYGNFIKFIKGYVSPNRETSNYKLLNIIGNFINGFPEDFDDYIKFANKYVNNSNGTTSEKFNMNDLNTGIDIFTENTNKPKYEIHVATDVIGGKITFENQKQIYCAYSDNKLMNMFYFLKNKKKQTREMPSERPFFSVNKILEKLEEIKNNNNKSKKGGYNKNTNNNENTKKHRKTKRICKRKC
jgi:hypothetical protein